MVMKSRDEKFSSQPSQRDEKIKKVGNHINHNQNIYFSIFT